MAQVRPKYSEPIFLKFDHSQIPEFKEVRSQDWIYYGKDNLWTDYVIELYQRSAKHNAIINGKVNYTIGSGFKSGQNQWVNRVNPYESLKDLTTKLSYDLELFNGFAIEVIYGITGKIVEMYHVDFSKIRTNKDESLYFFSDDWGQRDQTVRPDETHYKVYPSFDFGNPTGRQLYVYIIKTPRKSGEPNVYPIPEYMGALSAIETDVEISNFHLTNIKTGFSAGTMVSLLNGTPTQEEAKELEKKFKKKFTGTDKAGSLILNFAIDKEHAAEVLHMQPSDMDKQYLQMSDRVNQEIYTAHKIVSPTLFGVSTPGTLGQRNEMLDAFELFQSTYIGPRQTLFEDTFNKLASLNGMVADIEIKETAPLKFSFDSATIAMSLNLDEKRALISDYLGIDLVKTVAPPIPAQMRANDDEVLRYFSECGEDKNKYEVVKRKKFKYSSEKETFQAEIDGLSDIIKFRVYSPMEIKILSLIGKDNLIPSTEIAKALDIPIKQVDKVVNRLIEDKVITNREKGDNIEVNEPTKKGDKVIEKAPSILNFKVMYEYNLRLDAPDLVPGGSSRPFCKRLIGLNRIYKRSEIESISNNVGYNVWEHKGGFYNNPETHQIDDSCRHEWTQIIVTEK